MRHLWAVGAKLVDGAQCAVVQLKRVLVLGIVADMGIPAIEEADLARFALEITAFAALERLGRKVDE